MAQNQLRTRQNVVETLTAPQVDPINISLGILAMVEGLDDLKLQRVNSTALADIPNASLLDVQSELQILQVILAECKGISDELVNHPASFLLALQRCESLNRELRRAASEAGFLNSPQNLQTLLRNPLPEQLKNSLNRFEKAVLLFRDIATEYAISTQG